MPELDYLVLADYVRQDGGVIHIMGAGIDTINIPASSLPAAVPAGIAMRIMFSARDPVGEMHKLSLEFSGPPGTLLTAGQLFPTPPRPPGIPATWRHALGIAIKLALPLPAHGVYALQLMLDDDPRISRRIDLRAIEPGTG